MTEPTARASQPEQGVSVSAADIAVDATDDEAWSYTDDKAIPATVSVEPTASNAYGPPIFLKIERGGSTASIWLDRDTWEAMYRAGVEAHDIRVELIEQGWT